MQKGIIGFILIGIGTAGAQIAPVTINQNQKATVKAVAAPAKPSGGWKPAPAKPTPSSSANSNSQSQSAAVGQASANGGQGGSANTGASTSSASGGHGGAGGIGEGGSSTSAGGSSVAGGAQVGIGGTSNVSNSQVSSQFIPQVVPETPVSIVSGSGLVTQVTECGPKVQIIHRPVCWTSTGLFGSKKQICEGFTDTIAPFTDENGIERQFEDHPTPDGGYERWGSQQIIFAGPMGKASGRNIAAGGGGTGGWGQAGAGATSSSQQIEVTTLVRPCLFQRFSPPPIPTPPVVEYIPRDEPMVFPAPVAPVLPAPVSHKPKRKRPVMDCGPKVRGGK